MHAIVTGASNGIGERIARGLAERGAHVVLVGRDAGRLAAARERIGGDAEIEVADLSLVRETIALADRLAETPPDVVVSNAATITTLGETTHEGLTTMVAANHLAPFILLPRLAAAIGPLRAARFVIVGADPVSLAGRPVDLDDLMCLDHDALGEPEDIRAFRVYGRTKNMNAMFGYALARRLADTGITVNGAHPGIIGGTGLSRLAPDVRTAVAKLYDIDRADLPGVDAGADTPLWLATSEQVAGATGAFYVERRAVLTADHTTDPARCDLLWSRSQELVDRVTAAPVSPR